MSPNFSIRIAKCSVVKNGYMVLNFEIKKKSATFYFKSLNLTCLFRTPLPSVSAKSQIWNLRGKKNQSLYIYFNKNYLKDKLNPSNL